MRTCALLLMISGAAGSSALLAQETKESNRTVYTYDENGRRQAASNQASISGPGGGAQTQTITDFNGRKVQLESSEENVISDGPDGRVVERLVKKFDSQGHLTGQEKVRIEESKAADGTINSSRATVYERDLNGGYAMRERTTTVTSKEDSTVRAQTTVERPGVNGNLDLQERKVAVTTGDDKKSLTDVTVFRKDAQGQFGPAVREVTQTTKEGDKVVANTSEYNTAATGKMELTGQKLSQTVTNADGSETQVVDIFGNNIPGQSTSGFSSQPKLRERQLIERTPGPDKGMVETFSVQRPALDSERLGAPHKISETVCRGNCKN